MAEDFEINTSLQKEDKYELLVKQLIALSEVETDMLANFSNIIAGIKESFLFLWVGVYFAKGEELVLGPFQGPVACTRIAKGKGVCGTVFESEKTIIVDNVDEFPNHIACSSLSRSEIVMPIFNNGALHSVLDIDREKLAAFDKVDEKYLLQITQLLEQKITE